MLQTLRGAWVLRVLVVAVFMLRAAVPAGYMFASTSGGASLVLCSAQGAISVTVDPATGHVSIAKKAPGQQTDRNDAPCAFAGMAKVAVQAASVEPAAPSQPVAVQVFASLLVTPGQGLSAPPPPATGPPSRIS
jgi:hypothetical protein